MTASIARKSVTVAEYSLPSGKGTQRQRARRGGKTETEKKNKERKKQMPQRREKCEKSYIKSKEKKAHSYQETRSLCHWTKSMFLMIRT